MLKGRVQLLCLVVKYELKAGKQDAITYAVAGRAGEVRDSCVGWDSAHGRGAQDEKNVTYSRADVQELHKEILQYFSNLFIKQIFYCLFE